MANISFKRGLSTALNSLAVTDGQFIVCSDTREIFVDVGTSRIRIGDFVQVDSISALPASGANSTAMYYALAENVLCRYDETTASWKQINPDTGVTSVEVTGDGNAVTAASYDASTRKLTLTRGTTYMTAVDVDGKINTKVGDLTYDSTTYDTVKAYVDAKTSGIATDASLTALTNRVTTAEGEIDALQAAIGEGGSVTTAIADAKKAGTDAQATADQAKADAAAAQADIDALEGKVGTVPADTTVIDLITAAKTQADKGVTDAATAQAAAEAAQDDVDALETKVGTVPDGKTVVGMIAEAQAAATYDDSEVRGLISDNADAIAGVKSDVDTFLAAADIGGEAIDTLKEIQEYITTDGAAADQMVKDIAANKKAIEDEATTARAAESANAAAAAAAQTAADEAQADVDAIAADYLKTADKTALQGNIDAVSTRVTAIEDKGISDGANKVEASTTNGNIKIDGVETVVYTHPAEHAISEVTGLQDALDAKATVAALNTTNTNVQANADAISALDGAKADKATTLSGYGITDAYTKTETYTQAEVNALLTWDEF